MDVLQLSALEQARLVATRAVSSEELTRFYLDRIERLNPSLQAFVTVFRRGAVRDARAKDAITRRGGDLPPFHGVPTGIKDLNFVRWRVSRMGSRSFAAMLPFDDYVVRRLRAAGFVFLGKLATSEFGAMPVTEPDTHAPTRNPWNLERSPGGSSGGSAAAVAAGLLPIAHGSDGGGSIRIPASFCHLFGFKPGRHRVPNAFGIVDENVLYTCGPLARTVGDAAAMLDTMMDPSESLLSRLDTPPRSLRIRLSTRSPVARANESIEAAVRQAARVIESLGHVVEEVDEPDVTLDEFLPLWQRQVAMSARLGISRMQPITRWLATAGRGVDAASATRRHEDLSRRLTAWWGDADALITPTVPDAPPKIGAWRGLPPAEAFGTAARLGAFTAAFNVTGQPAASVPLGVDADGLPMGLQVAVRRGEDALLASLCRQLEQVLPWSQRQSPMYGTR